MGLTMKCSEIDEAFAPFSPTAVKPNAVNKQQQAAPKPLPSAVVDAAEAKAKAEKLRKMAAIMQAKRLKAARTQFTADDLAMAFSLANR